MASDPAQARMDELADQRRDERIAAALKADGYDVPSMRNSQWVDPAVTWLPEGHRSVVTVTAISKTINGWQCRVVRRQVNADGVTVPSGDGKGFVYLDTLMRDYQMVTP